jgi:hypothetical protein
VLRFNLVLVTIDAMSVELPPLSSNAPIFVRLLPRLAPMVEAALAAGVAAVPEGAGLPEGHFADVVPLSLEYAALFLKRIDDGEAITRADMSNLEALVTQFAEDRVPLRSLTDGYLGGLQVFWQMIVEVAEPSDIHDLAALGAHLIATIGMLTTTVTDAYVDVQQSIFGLERESRRVLCAAMLRGEPAVDLAARAGAAIAESYDVIAILAGAGLAPTENADAIVKRRWARWAQQALDDIAGALVLNTFDGSSGVALLPVVDGGRQQAMHDLAVDLASRFGVNVFVAERLSVPRAQLPEAAQECAEVADLARLLGRRTGLHGLQDLLLEYQMTRPGPARDLLARQLEPVLDQPHLMEALKVLMRHGLDRKTAASELHIHPNTFTYRLHRVAELTGIDPSDAHGSRLLAAALTVHRAFPADTSHRP